jgi:hypothetical protein
MLWNPKLTFYRPTIPKTHNLQQPFLGSISHCSKQHGKSRDLLLDKAMRCHRCVAYTSKVAPRLVILSVSQSKVLQYKHLLPLSFSFFSKFDSTGLLEGTHISTGYTAKDKKEQKDGKKR